MADQDLNSYSAVTTPDDSSLLPVRANSDGFWRKITWANLKAAVKAAIYNKATINVQTGTTYTLVLTDAGKAVTMDNASANTATIPANSAVAFDTGTQLTVWQKGAGTTTVTGDTGVTVNGTSAGGAEIGEQYHAVALLKIATDTWFMTGDHGTVS